MARRVEVDRSDPAAVSATAIDRGGPDTDNTVTTVEYGDGSCGALIYNSQGHSGLGKERVEVFGGNQSLVIDDFARLEVHGAGATREKGGVVQKGHYEILAHFAEAVAGRARPAIGPVDGYWATWCAEQSLAALRDGSRPPAA